MKTKTSELEGAALDWAVAVATGLGMSYARRAHQCGFRPSTDWSQGGPLMTRLEMLTRGHGIWYAIPICVDVIELSGYTPLVAAMRAIVASELGDEVDIPDELLED